VLSSASARNSSSRSKLSLSRSDIIYSLKRLFETVSCDPDGAAMRLRTISDSGRDSTAPELGGRAAWNGRNWRSDRQVQALGGVAPGPGDFEDLEGIDE